jgi:hypothetical protein
VFLPDEHENLISDDLFSSKHVFHSFRPKLSLKFRAALNDTLFKKVSEEHADYKTLPENMSTALSSFSAFSCP